MQALAITGAVSCVQPGYLSPNRLDASLGGTYAHTNQSNVALSSTQEAPAFVDDASPRIAEGGDVLGARAELRWVHRRYRFSGQLAFGAQRGTDYRADPDPAGASLSFSHPWHPRLALGVGREFRLGPLYPHLDIYSGFEEWVVDVDVSSADPDRTGSWQYARTRWVVEPVLGSQVPLGVGLSLDLIGFANTIGARGFGGGIGLVWSEPNHGTSEDPNPPRPALAPPSQEERCASGDPCACVGYDMYVGGEMKLRQASPLEFAKACEKGCAQACPQAAEGLARLAGTRPAQRSALMERACKLGGADACSELIREENGAGERVRWARVEELAGGACRPERDVVSATCETLGWMRENGLGGLRSPRDALRFYFAACGAGSRSACIRGASLVEAGSAGTPVDARDMLTMACRLDDADACERIRGSSTQGAGRQP